MKRILAVTHAEKSSGVNPGLTTKGKEDIQALTAKLPRTKEIPCIIIGTGDRFWDVYVYLGLAILHKPHKFSPLLGSADSGEKTETSFRVILANGMMVPVGKYIGLIGTPGIDLWAWLQSLEDGTLLCTGREFIGALGVKNAEAGAIYEIDTETKTAKKME
ncbi:MAG: hypothetical protein WCW14_03015 [Candidatus Paceibacterota bacterium]